MAIENGFLNNLQFTDICYQKIMQNKYLNFNCA